MKLIKLIICVLLAIPSISIADGPGWSQVSEVQRLVVIVNGGINVRLSPELSGCTSLSGYGAKYASVHPDHPGLDKIYSLLLAAQASKTPVRIYLSDDTCKIGEAVFGGSY